MVDGIMGPRSMEVVHRDDQNSASTAASGSTQGSFAQEQGANMCFNEKEWLKQCLGRDGETHETCTFYADLLKQCYQTQGK